MITHHDDSPCDPERIPFRAVIALRGWLSGLSWPVLPGCHQNATHLLMAPMTFFQAGVSLVAPVRSGLVFTRVASAYFGLCRLMVQAIACLAAMKSARPQCDLCTRESFRGNDPFSWQRPHLMFELWQCCRTYGIECVFLPRYTTPLLCALDKTPHANLKKELADGLVLLRQRLKGAPVTKWNMLPALCRAIARALTEDTNRQGFKEVGMCMHVPLGTRGRLEERRAFRKPDVNSGGCAVSV